MNCVYCNKGIKKNQERGYTVVEGFVCTKCYDKATKPTKLQKMLRRYHKEKVDKNVNK